MALKIQHPRIGISFTVGKESESYEVNSITGHSKDITNSYSGEDTVHGTSSETRLHQDQHVNKICDNSSEANSQADITMKFRINAIEYCQSIKNIPRLFIVQIKELIVLVTHGFRFLFSDYMNQKFYPKHKS